jgi:hypothetical protein
MIAKHLADPARAEPAQDDPASAAPAEPAGARNNADGVNLSRRRPDPNQLHLSSL